jgi:drug/metabolite transporter (DMT)-like permease
VLGAAQRQARRFLVKGIGVALVGGLLYGVYSAFITQAQSEGPWPGWAGEASPLTAFAAVYVVGMLACAVNDTLGAIWCLGLVVAKGKLRDFWRSLRSKPGGVMVICAVIGGPVANGAYVVALNMAGPSAAPITALCPVIGAIIGRLLFKQVINLRMGVGIAICLAASFLIGSSSLGQDAPKGMALGLVIAFIAALGWGIEGAVAGAGTVLIDYQIGIAIRELVAGLGNLVVFVPVLCLLAGEGSLFGSLLGEALTDGPSLALFAIAGLACASSFGLWYRGNSMCGAALGMACNATYSFWTPLFCWLVVGVGFGQAGQSVPVETWVAAPVMCLGVLLVAVNPLKLGREAVDEFAGLPVIEPAAAPASDAAGAPAGDTGGRRLPVNYALLRQVAALGQAGPDELIAALAGTYGGSKALTRQAVAEALAAAEKNGVLAKCALSQDQAGQVTIVYQPTATGAAMIRRYIG